MAKQADIYFRHMLDAISKIERYVKDQTRAKFLHDDKTSDAVVREFEIIGEAARNVPQDSVQDSPVAWKKMIGMRNLLIHQYFGINLDAVWDTTQTGLSELKKYLKRKLEK